MKKEVGLWIDHHRTVIVSVVDEKEITREVRSNVDRHVKISERSHAGHPRSSSLSGAEDVGDRKYENQLSGYYDGVVSLIRNADSIWIFGPGEAKVELKNRLERQELGERIISVEPAGKMTDRQIAAKARLHFSQ